MGRRNALFVSRESFLVPWTTSLAVLVFPTRYSAYLPDSSYTLQCIVGNDLAHQAHFPVVTESDIRLIGRSDTTVT